MAHETNGDAEQSASCLRQSANSHAFPVRIPMQCTLHHGWATAPQNRVGPSSEYSCECIGANGFGVGKARGEGNGDGSEPQLHWAHCSGPKGAAVALTRVRRATVQPFALHRRGISLFQLSPPIPHRGQGRFGFGLLHDATDTIADAIVRPLRARGSAEGRTSREELLRLLHDPDRRPAGVDRTAQPDRRGEVLRVPLEECAEGLRRTAATSAVQWPTRQWANGISCTNGTRPYSAALSALALHATAATVRHGMAVRPRPCVRAALHCTHTTVQRRSRRRVRSSTARLTLCCHS